MPRTSLSRDSREPSSAGEGEPAAKGTWKKKTIETHNRLDHDHFDHGTASLLAWGQRLLLIVLIVGFAIKGFGPAWRHLNSDFPNYYLVARLYRAGYSLERVYDWTWLQRQKDHLGIEQGLVSFIPSTLPSALVVAPWCKLPPLEAKHQWLILNLGLLLVTGFLIGRLTNLGWERIALITLLAFVPLCNNFLFGQMHVVLLLLIALAAYLFFRGLHFTSGLILAMAAALKVYPALFLIFFLWKRRWRAAIGLVVGLLSVAAISVCIFGADACWFYVHRVLPWGLRGETLDPYNPGWNSWTALLRRLFVAEPELNPFPVMHLPWLYAALLGVIESGIFVAFMWAIGPGETNTERTKLEWAAFLFLLMFLSSEPGSYHFVVLILSGALILDYLLARARRVEAALVLAVYALIGVPLLKLPGATPVGWENLLFFSRLAFMTLFATLLLWILRQSSKTQCRFRTAATAVCVWIAISIASFLSTEKHLSRQFDNYRSRVATSAGSLLASQPAVRANGILFTKMTASGYAIRGWQSGGFDDVVSGGADWFHAATYQGETVTWAERSARDRSDVMRVRTAGAGETSSTTNASVEFVNAEEPVISPDGRSIAFFRPVGGRNTLWTARIDGIAGAPGSRGDAHISQAWEIAGEEYDATEPAFFPDGRLIFSSKRSGRYRLYVASSTPTIAIEELRRPICAAHYPAVSPDGKWIAFSCEAGSGSELHVTDMNGENDVLVTSGDCNSVSPAWTADSKSLVYATDCGRGLGLTALAQVTVFP